MIVAKSRSTPSGEKEYAIAEDKSAPLSWISEAEAKSKYPELVKAYKKAKKGKKSSPNTGPTSGPPSGLGPPTSTDNVSKRSASPPSNPAPPSKAATSPTNPPPPPLPQHRPEANDADDDENESEDDDEGDNAALQTTMYDVISLTGVQVRKNADETSALVGNVPFGESVTVRDKSKLCFDGSNNCLGKNASEADDTHWRAQIISPKKWRGWISLEQTLVTVNENPEHLQRQSIRQKVDYLHEMTRTMIDVSLIAARHSAQLRSQRKKVCQGFQDVVRAEDPRVLGVLSQMTSDEQYETRVSNSIRNGLDVITSIFSKVQAAENEIALYSESKDYRNDFEQADDAEMNKLLSHYAQLKKELNDIQAEKALAKSLANLE